MLPIDLTGKTALITGATGQLGRVITRTLARSGAAVIIHYLHNADMAETLVAEAQALGVRAMAAPADVTNWDSIVALRDVCAAGLGLPDILVNNAVIQYQWVSVLDQPAADYESQFRSCVLHNAFMAKAFVPEMIRRKWGRIIAINTECAMQNVPNQSAYVSGKRGMDGLLRVLAREVAEHHITVNQVAPGWMISDRDRAAGTQRSEHYDQNVPMKHRGEDLDIAHAVAFFSSDLARFITGIYLPVSGGTVMPAI
jgi:3-oxoacyl-[acyl-carrier protein] reductase